MYKILFTLPAKKDAIKVNESRLKSKVQALLEILAKDPWQPPYEKLWSELEGLYSRRINLQHRLVYQVYKEERIIKIVSMWGHYNDN